MHADLLDKPEREILCNLFPATGEGAISSLSSTHLWRKGPGRGGSHRFVGRASFVRDGTNRKNAAGGGAVWHYVGRRRQWISSLLLDILEVKRFKEIQKIFAKPRALDL
jgi:hypothetical protein